ncbi:hypothetical protein [Streptomyces sp. SD15]
MTGDADPRAGSGQAAEGESAVLSASAAWAVLGKEEGSRRDYKVLSALQNRISFYDRQVRDHLPGTPVDPLRPPPTPYYVYWPGPTTKQGAPTLNCSRFERTDVRDGTGRTSLRMHFFNVRLSDLHDGHEPVDGVAGYTDLARAMDGAAWAMPDDHAELVRLDFRPAAVPAAVQGAALRGFEWLATGAAAVLAGRVVITGAQDVSVSDRLRCLDAIGGLLPYGARSMVAAATFAQASGMHGIRLFFDDLAPQGAFALPWESPVVPPPPAAGRRYLELLLRQRQTTTPAALFTALLGVPRPRSLEDPQAVLEAAERALHPHADITADLRTGAAAADRARALLTKGREKPPLGPEETALWWRSLLTGPGAGDTGPTHLRALAWAPGPGNLGTLAPGLLSVLPCSEGVDTVVWYCARADEAGLLGDLLALLVRKVDADAPETLRALLAVLNRTRYDTASATALAEALGRRTRLLTRMRGADTPATLDLLTALSRAVPDHAPVPWLRLPRALLHDRRDRPDGHDRHPPSEEDIFEAYQQITGFVGLIEAFVRERRPDRRDEALRRLAPLRRRLAEIARADARAAELLVLEHLSTQRAAEPAATSARSALELGCTPEEVVDALVSGSPDRPADELRLLLRDVGQREARIRRLESAALRPDGALDRTRGTAELLRHIEGELAAAEHQDLERGRELTARKSCLTGWLRAFHRRSGSVEGRAVDEW